jgi:hypothetical protein
MLTRFADSAEVEQHICVNLQALLENSRGQRARYRLSFEPPYGIRAVEHLGQYASKSFAATDKLLISK